MFHVEGGPEFNGLAPLIEHYMKNSVVDTPMSVLNLKHPFYATSFFPANVSQRISKLLKPSLDVYWDTGFEDEYSVGGNESQSPRPILGSAN